MAKRQRNGRDIDKATEADARDKTLFRALRDAFEWAIDVAAHLARDYPEEVESVERLRAYLRSRLAGNSTKVPVEDILFVLAILISAIERGCGAIGLEPDRSVALRLPGSQTSLPHVPRVFIRSWTRSISRPTALA